MLEDDYEILQRVFEIVNIHTSAVTGWPYGWPYRTFKTKKGRVKRWSRERYDTWFHLKFVETGLMRPHPMELAWNKPDSYEEDFKDFYKSRYGFTHSVRKDFALKILTLGYLDVISNT
jgi:hypothetical protein